MSPQAEPAVDCSLCERLVAFRKQNAAQYPDWFNAPVPSFGSDEAQLLIVGLAPGLQGANKTGRPFTGDYAGDLLYATLLKFGFAQGAYHGCPDDGLELVNCMITNAVRCVPPQNKPIASEIKSCGNYLKARINSMPRVQVILALGRIAHDSTLVALEERKAAWPFKHGHQHIIREATDIHNAHHQLILLDSYHCSRYNTNTGRLTIEMFEAVFAQICNILNG